MALKRGSKKRYYGKKQGKGWKKRFFKLSLQKLSCISAKAKQHIGNYRYKKNERDEKTYKEDLHGACPLSKHHYIGM